MHVVGALGLGGGAAPAAVTAPSPTTESVAAGGTPAAKTFGAFTDPDSRIASYSATTTNSVGSATWTGTGLGAYTIGSSADGDSGTLALTALDSSGDPLATAYHSWDIAAAGGATWTDLVDLDYTGLDVQSPLSDAATTVTKGAVQFGPAIKVVRYTGSVAVIETGAAGVTITGASNVGWLQFAADVSAYVDFDANKYLPLRLDMVFTTMTGMNSSTDGVQGGMLSGNDWNSAAHERSVRCNWSSGALMSTNASRQNTNTNIATGVSVPTASVFTLTTVLHAGIVAAMWYTAGTPPSDATIEAGGTYALPANSSPMYTSAIWAAWRGIYTAGATLTRIRVRALQ
jgi:hypothetical protein